MTEQYQKMPLPQGEIMGSILIGLIYSFKSIRAISNNKADDLVKDYKSAEWYPMADFFNLLRVLCVRNIDYKPILFQAGSAFIRDWYFNGPGKNLLSSSIEYLKFQGATGGYEAVHRGDSDDIGWQELIELNEEAGYAKILCVNPYPKAFEHGVFYAGVMMFDDMEYVEVSSEEEPCSLYLNKKNITIKFRKKITGKVQGKLDSVVKQIESGDNFSCSKQLLEALVWQHKHLELEKKLNEDFYLQSSKLLSEATDEIFALSKKMENFALYDELTGILNRRAILEKTKRKLIKSKDSKFAFFMIDIDNFKDVNDTFGHAIGNKTLRSVTSTLKECLRPDDFVGRIGGDEFLIVLPDSGIYDASVMAAKLRSSIEKNIKYYYYNTHHSVTISVGVTVISTKASGNIDDFLRMADIALYCSKNNGRNQVSFYYENPCFC